MANNSNIAIIILAAGTSSRMGQPKQLLPWGNTTLLGHSINQALGSNANQVFVVLGAYFEEIADSIKSTNAVLLKNNMWSSGLGASIAFGVNFIQKKGFDAILLMLADQPQIDASFLNKLIIRFQQEKQPIIATAYKKEGGVPVIFSNTFFKELAKLKGDKGAKHVIERNKANVFILPHQKIIDDIDTIETYNRLLNLL